MKEQVTDISKVMRDMTAEMRLMSETINLQYAEIAKLNRNIESLNHQIRKKDNELAQLRERLSLYENPNKNSGNSSILPSKEHTPQKWSEHIADFSARPSMRAIPIQHTSLSRPHGLTVCTFCSNRTSAALARSSMHSKKGQIKCRDYIFSFLKDPVKPSDNNGSERGNTQVENQVEEFMHVPLRLWS